MRYVELNLRREFWVEIIELIIINTWIESEGIRMNILGRRRGAEEPQEMPGFKAFILLAD